MRTLVEQAKHEEIGERVSDRLVPLYPHKPRPSDQPALSFVRPARIFWQAIATELARQGWTEEEILNWISSKATRHMFDGPATDAVTAAAHALAKPGGALHSFVDGYIPQPVALRKRAKR